MHRQLEDIELASVALGVTSGFSKCKKNTISPDRDGKITQPPAEGARIQVVQSDVAVRISRHNSAIPDLVLAEQARILST
jgi:hypothetical protein